MLNSSKNQSYGQLFMRLMLEDASSDLYRPQSTFRQLASCLWGDGALLQSHQGNSEGRLVSRLKVWGKRWKTYRSQQMQFVFLIQMPWSSICIAFSNHISRRALYQNKDPPIGNSDGRTSKTLNKLSIVSPSDSENLHISSTWYIFKVSASACWCQLLNLCYSGRFNKRNSCQESRPKAGIVKSSLQNCR